MANYKIVSHASAGLPLNVATTTGQLYEVIVKSYLS